MNEIEHFAARNQAEGEESNVDLVAGVDEGEGTESAGAPEAPGISKKKKQMVMMGVGGGLVLVAALAVVNIFSGAPQEPMAQYDQSPQQANQAPDPSGLVSNPGAGAPAAPLIGDTMTSSPTAPSPIAGFAQAPAADPSAPIPLNQMLESNSASASPVASAGVVQPPLAAPAAPTAPAAAQVAPSLVQSSQTAPVAPTPIAAVAPSQPSPTAPLSASPMVASAVVAAPAAPAKPTSPVATPIQAAVTESSISATEAALRSEIAKLKAENKVLAGKLANQPKVQVAAAPKPKALPSAPVAAPTSPPSAANVRASDLKGVITQTAAKPTNKSARGDFSIYAVTDGRVWVVGKDGERLGPLAVGSPLTDGSKITGIDVARGVVLTNSGEIH